MPASCALRRPLAGAHPAAACAAPAQWAPSSASTRPSTRAAASTRWRMCCGWVGGWGQARLLAACLPLSGRGSGLHARWLELVTMFGMLAGRRVVEDCTCAKGGEDWSPLIRPWHGRCEHEQVALWPTGKLPDGFLRPQHIRPRCAPPPATPAGRPLCPCPTCRLPPPPPPQPGTEMVAAGYCMYGSMSYMMITTGKGVAGFTLDPTLGECPPPRGPVPAPRSLRVLGTLRVVEGGLRGVVASADGGANQCGTRCSAADVAPFCWAGPRMFSSQSPSRSPPPLPPAPPQASL